MAQLNNYQLNAVATVLKNYNVDGEDMQQILDMVGMSEQMLRQLVMSCPLPQMLELMDEKVELDQGGWVTSGDDVAWIVSGGSI
jgi:hypothetical protein